MRRSHITLVAVLCVLGLFGSLASASIILADPSDPTSYTIAEVIRAGGIRVGDKVFTEWRVTTNRLGAALAPDATAISLTPVVRAGEIGFRFDGLWAAGSMQLADTTIIFRVEADRPWLITDNTLQMSAYGTDNGGIATISENVYLADPDKLPGPSIARKFVYSDSATGALKEIDHQVFAVASPVVWVVKDVGANGGLNRQGIAKVSSFYQTFSQIPEPATLSLLAIGGLLLLRRKR